MDKIISYLKQRKNKTIALTEISKIFSGDTTYEELAKIIKILEEKTILKPVKSHGTNYKGIPLYNTYTINKNHFKKEFLDEIQTFKLNLHESINIDSYLSLKENEWDKDISYIETIDEYIKVNGLPNTSVSAPERSYEIIGDEKWIDEKGGRKVLERIKLLDKLKISYKNDPLMIAINPKEINKKIHKHMIVENKASFHDFLDVLNDTNFTSLIFGSGWKIVSNISMLEKQLGLYDCEHRLFYFGDIDYEGISIWNAFNDKQDTNVTVAVDFYNALLQKTYTKGKTNQNKNTKALNNFLSNFNDKERSQIKALLDDDGYYPQEALNKEDIRRIWRNDTWTW